MKKFTSVLLAMAVVTLAAMSGCSKPTAPTPTSSAAIPSSSSAAPEGSSSEQIAENPLNGKTIKVGCSSTFVPFESVSVGADGKKTYVGMNVELIQAIAKKNGATVEFMDMPFKSLIGAIQAGHIDMNIGGMMPTEERMKSLDFSEIYFYPRNAIVYKSENSYTTLESLEGKTVAYAFGTNYQAIVESIKDVKGSGIQGSPACVEEVKTGRADACIIDGAGAAEFIKVNQGLSLSLLEKTEDCFAIGFPKNSPYFETVNNTLKEMMQNGELDTIIAKYLSKEFILN